MNQCNINPFIHSHILPLRAQTVIYCRNTCDKACQVSTCNCLQVWTTNREESQGQGNL